MLVIFVAKIVQFNKMAFYHQLHICFFSGSAVKNSPAMQEPQEKRVRSLGWEDLLK